MVFLTICRYARYAGPERMWRNSQFFRLSWRMYGRSRNCIKLARLAVRRSLRFAMWSRAAKKQYMKDVFKTRIAAGAQEHGLTYEQFMDGLAMSNVELNGPTLQELAIYEPRTFKSLCELSKQKLLDAGIALDGVEPPRGVITRGMLDKAIVPGNQHWYS